MTVGLTPRWKLRFLDRGQSLNETRDVLEDNAGTVETALTGISNYVNQLATVIPGGQTVIGIDTDGVPYFDPNGAVTNPAGVGVDTDGVPYIVEWTYP